MQLIFPPSAPTASRISACCFVSVLSFLFAGNSSASDQTAEKLVDGFALRINCAGSAWTDPDGNHWEADRAYEKGRWGAIDGKSADRGDIHIENTRIAPIYRTERCGPTEYRITCPDGVYQVTLHFAETYPGTKGPGERVFAISLNDCVVASDIDPMKMGGGLYRPVVKTFETTITNEMLIIGFQAITGGTLINGIEVIQTQKSAAASPLPTILSGSPTTPGLCLLVGCGNTNAPELIAELAAQTPWLVHGLATSPDARARAREAIAQHHVAGQAMVEMLPIAKLPYPDNLANVVIAEDFDQLATQGLTREELMRVTAPDGVIWIEQNGQWKKTQKPWPIGMDDWTHPNYRPDGNRVSTDSLLRFPLGMRWQDGVPTSIIGYPTSMVLAHGRVFTLSGNVSENLLPFRRSKSDEYILARDAFNGLPLWKEPNGVAQEDLTANARNLSALVTDNHRVYCYRGSHLVALEAATGKVCQDFPAKYRTARLLLTNETLVAVGWPGRQISQEKDTWIMDLPLWAPSVSKTNQASIQAFDTQTGVEKWSQNASVQDVLCSDGLIFMFCQEGNPATTQSIHALDLTSGKEIWVAGHDTFAPECAALLALAGDGVVIVERPRARKISVLSAASGKLLWEKPGQAVHLVSGRLWLDQRQYDPRTAAELGTVPELKDNRLCNNPTIVGHYYLSGHNTCVTFSDDYTQALETNKISGNRAACLEGPVTAEGMLVTAENNCSCAPGDLPGTLAMGPVGDLPQQKEFERVRVVEQGPAFGKFSASTSANASTADWPTYRHDVERSASTTTSIPQNLKILWQTNPIQPFDGPLAAAWKARLLSCVSAPVIADGRIYVTDVHRGTIIALDAATGIQQWRATVASRVDGPPTVWHGMCIFGCHDGSVYALRATDGALAWRTCIAPADRRMVAFGAVESVWPAIGAVTVFHGTVYASAGRATETDGGLALMALDPRTGMQQWAKRIDNTPGRQNDLLRMEDGKLALHDWRFDPANGACSGNAFGNSQQKYAALEGWLDSTWLLANTRRSGRLTFGSIQGEMFAWDDHTVYGYTLKNRALFAIPREKTACTNMVRSTDYAWTIRQSSLHDMQPEALARGANALVTAGRIQDYDAHAPERSILCTFAANDGKLQASLPLSAPPVFEGLALAQGCIFVTLQDGSVVCVGAQK